MNVTISKIENNFAFIDFKEDYVKYGESFVDEYTQKLKGCIIRPSKCIMFKNYKKVGNDSKYDHLSLNFSGSITVERIELSNENGVLNLLVFDGNNMYLTNDPKIFLLDSKTPKYFKEHPLKT